MSFSAVDNITPSYLQEKANLFVGVDVFFKKNLQFLLIVGER